MTRSLESLRPKNSGPILTPFSPESLEAGAQPSTPLFCLKCLWHPLLPFHPQSSYSSARDKSDLSTPSFSTTLLPPTPPEDSAGSLFPRLPSDHGMLSFSFVNIPLKKFRGQKRLGPLKRWVCWMKEWRRVTEVVSARLQFLYRGRTGR